MQKRRKYLEPSYGEVGSEVAVGAPQIFDAAHADRWRRRNNLESVAAMTTAMMQCSCYEAMMHIEAQDLTVDHDGFPIPIRVYYPEGAGPFPVLVFIHGGGFVFNNIDVYEYVNRYLCLSGNIVVVSPDYRLAPEFRFPTGLEDCYKVVEWVVEHADRIKGDTKRVSVGGDSAGGNMTAAITLKARDEHGPQIARQILVYPLTTHVGQEESTSVKKYGKGDHFLLFNGKDDTDLLFVDKADAKKPYASPMLAKDHTNLPPACFVSAECDPLLDQGLEYAAVLEDAGVEVSCHIMKGMLHGFINSAYEKSFEALRIISAFAKEV